MTLGHGDLTIVIHLRKNDYMNDPRIERKIITGLIVSTEFLQGIRQIWTPQLLQSGASKRIARWCIEYYDTHKKAPGKDIETIFLVKVKQEKIPKDVAEEIETDILPGLSEEYSSQHFNFAYLIDQTTKYLSERHLENFAKSIQLLLEQGELLEAEKLAHDYKTIIKTTSGTLDLSDPIVLEKIEKIFTHEAQPVVTFPGALGTLWNNEMVRGGFVAFMASEKRGKSYLLLEVAIRASKQGAQVAFFQAGDMSEGQQLKRICTYKTKQPFSPLKDLKKFIPVKDCIYNQDDSCNKKERECDHGIFTEKDILQMNEKIRKKITMEFLQKKFKENPDYKPCYNCLEWKDKPWGAVWIKAINPKQLTYIDGQTAIKKFFVDRGRKFKLSSHANNTLSVKEIEALIELWEKQDGFSPDVIVVDYADILVSDVKEFRHSQNDIWKSLRGLSQKRHCLVITATQADAKSYEQERLTLSNFSEDKRKYAHVTAMYGLNQDPHGREKELGVLRINELVVRDSEFYTSTEVHVLQALNIGQPFLGSFW